MGRTSVIAITQFVFLSLGLMALTVLVNAGAITVSNNSGSLALFLKQNGLWLLLIPVFWGLFANMSGRMTQTPLFLNIAHGIGCLLAGAILVVFALAIL